MEKLEDCSLKIKLCVRVVEVLACARMTMLVWEKGDSSLRWNPDAEPIDKLLSPFNLSLSISISEIVIFGR